jgi:hypothetical protein
MGKPTGAWSWCGWRTDRARSPRGGAGARVAITSRTQRELDAVVAELRARRRRAAVTADALSRAETRPRSGACSFDIGGSEQRGGGVG